MSIPPLLLRTDGGPTIGGGHVMRCLALAQAWSDAGGRIGFCAAILSSPLQQRLADERIELVQIDGGVGGPEDAEATLAAARHFGASVAVVDGYHLSVDFRRRLRRAGLKVAAIDDNGEIGHYVDDVVINQNRHASPALYPQREDYTRLLLGTEYALLRREFRDWQGPARSFPAAPRQVLVTLGAADPNNITADIVACLASVLPAKTEAVIVIGGSNPHADAIAARAQKLPSFRLVRDAGPDLPGLMAAADLGICAGGSTMWEMACMGVPFIPIVIAENQRGAVAAMARDGYPSIHGGPVGRELPPVLTALIADADRRQELSRIGRELVDGKGVERVCAALRVLSGQAAVV
jgi:UDP-2,4-diacetamido-2,4,6-trideoxy-beta-L-altropyranose hydrolase